MLFSYGYRPVCIDEDGNPVWDVDEIKPLMDAAMRSNPAQGNKTRH